MSGLSTEDFGGILTMFYSNQDRNSLASSTVPDDANHYNVSQSEKQVHELRGKENL